LASVVKRMFRCGLIDPTFMGYANFRRDLARTLADPERMAGCRDDGAGPLDDLVLTRLRGAYEAFPRGVYDAQNTPTLCAGVSAANGRAGPRRP